MVRTYITQEFLKRIRKTGALAEAALRVVGKEYEPLPGMSTWALVCEEVVDTEYEPEHYERVVAELARRGITGAELEEMRVFAWDTAGWLNFDRMVWDWTGLDERDVRMAIEWQLKEGDISSAEAERRYAYVERYVGGVHGGRGGG